MPKVNIDGHEIEVPAGTTLLQAAEELGLEVPQMCYHPGLEIVGVCRVCLCQVKGMPKMTPACATEVRDGMEVGLYTPEAEKARRSVIEFWLLNHPLDCPICDQGGECPLQDIAFDHGPGESRLNDPKVKKRKRVDLGPHVILDEERCILCWRCTRFTQDISGSNQIMLNARGVFTTVGTPPDQEFDDAFSGNVVDLCPVGALTTRDFRFKSRVWEMSSSEGVCTGCNVGCSTYTWSKKGHVERLTARPNLSVNDYWLCDRGRFDINFINDPARLTRPRVRVDGELVEVDWDDALNALTAGLTPAAGRGQNKAGALFTPHLSNEEYWSWQKFMRSGLGSNHLAVGRDDLASPAKADLAARGRTLSSITEVEKVDAVLVLGDDLETTHPVYSLRLRKAVRQHGVRLYLATPQSAHLDAEAVGSERVPTAKAAAWLEDTAAKLQRGEREGLAGALAGVGKLAVLVNAGAENTRVAQAAEALLGAGPSGSSWRMLILDEGGNASGSRMLGVSPNFFPGHRPVNADEAQVWKSKWGGRVHGTPGLSWEPLLKAAGGGEVNALLLINSGRPANWNFTGPEIGLLKKVPFVAAFDMLGHEVESFAHVLLPSPSFAEMDATYTTADGVVQLARRNIVPKTWTTLQVLHKLAAQMGVKLKGPQPIDIFREIARDVPAYAGLDYGRVSGEGARPPARSLAAAR